MDNNNTNYNPELDMDSAPDAADIALPDVDADIPEFNSIGPINTLDDASVADIPGLPEMDAPAEESAAAPATAPAFAAPNVQAVYPSGNVPQQIAMYGTPIVLTAPAPLPKPRKGEWLALAGFLCGIVSVSLTWGSKLSYVCAVVALVGIVLAAVAAKKGVRTTMQSTGLTLSIIGLVCSIVTTVCCMAINSCAESMAESFMNSIPQDVMSDIMEGDADALAEYLQEYIESTDGMNFD